MKIAHISDLHLNTIYRDSNLREIKSLLSFCNEINVDHLAITGDLTDDASEVDLKILKKTLKSFGFYNGEKLSVIIGNHDIYGGVQKAEEIFTYPERCRNANYNEKIKVFNSIFEHTFDNCVYRSDLLSYPYAKIVKDVLFIGINSNAEYSSVTNPFASNGEVSYRQQSELTELLLKFKSLVKYKVILIHHHFNKIKNPNNLSAAGLWQNIEKQTMKLRKKKKLLKIFNKFNIDLVLHGHLHETKSYQKSDVNFLNAGGSIKCVNSKKLKFNIARITPAGIDCEIIKLPRDYFNSADNAKNFYIRKESA
ncbi:MAG: metallophosphoesterase [Ignavibacteria bacterium]|jgi:3',5'-cyclic AMP phosphodiesterase CpdA